jgi:hypothetical protein
MDFAPFNLNAMEYQAPDLMGSSEPRSSTMPGKLEAGPQIFRSFLPIPIAQTAQIELAG